MMDSLEEITEKSLLAEEDTGTRHPPQKKKLYQGNDDGNEEKQNKIYKSGLCISLGLGARMAGDWWLEKCKSSSSLMSYRDNLHTHARATVP